MKNKKTLPYLLFFALIVSIAVTAYSILQHSAKAQNGDDAPLVPDVNTDLVTDNKNKLDEYHTTYPKQASEEEGFLYAQTLSGEGDIVVKNIHQRPQGYFVITESRCAFGDITAKVQTIVVFFCDSLGAITKFLPISTRLPMTFLASKVTADGLVILAKTSENSYLITVNTDLTDYSTSMLPAADNGNLFLYGNECLTFLEGSQNTLHYKSSVAFLPSGKIVAVFGFSDHIKIFLNTNSGYSVISCNNRMQITERINVLGDSIACINPIVENGVQKYLVVEKGIETTVYKFDGAFRKDTAEKAPLGSGGDVKMYPAASGIMMVFSGRQGGVYMLSNDLEVTVTNSELFSSATNVYDSVRYAGGYYFLVETLSGLSLVDLRLDTTTASKPIGMNSEKAFIGLNANGTISIFYNAEKNGKTYVKILGSAII